MKKIFLLNVVLFVLATVGPLAYSFYEWPVSARAIKSVGSMVKDDKLYTVIEASGEVKTINTGIIHFIRKNNGNNGLPSIIEILGDDGILYMYINVSAYGSIGDTVNRGITLGRIDADSLIIRAVENNSDIDILTILPNIKRTLLTKIESFTFEQLNLEKDTREIQDFSRRISSGIQTIEIVLNIKDYNSSYHIIPNLIVIQFLNTDYVITGDMIRERSLKIVSLDQGLIRIRILDVDIPRSRYINFLIRVEAPFNANRFFRFSSFAY